MLGKNFSRHFEIFFSYFSQKVDFEIPCKLSPEETICIEYQSLFSEKNKKTIIGLLSAEFAQRMVKIKACTMHEKLLERKGTEMRLHVCQRVGETCLKAYTVCPKYSNRLA